MPRSNTTDYLTAQEEDEAFRQRANRERANVYATKGIEINGREFEVPIWHPGMTLDQAESAARDRLEVGLSPFASEEELAREQGSSAQTPEDLDARYKAQPAVQQVIQQNIRSTYQYPTGDGTYTTLDAHGNPVSDSNDPSDLQGREREGSSITPEEMDRLYKARQLENEKARAAAMNESPALAGTPSQSSQIRQLYDKYYGPTPPELLLPDFVGEEARRASMMAQRGGRIGGTGGGDTQHIMGEPGEFIINKYDAQRIGYGNLERENSIAGGGAGMVEPGRTGYQSDTAPRGFTQFWPGGGRWEGPNRVAAGPRILGGKPWQYYDIRNKQAPFIGLEGPSGTLGKTVKVPGESRPGKVIDIKQQGYTGYGVLRQGRYDAKGNYIPGSGPAAKAGIEPVPLNQQPTPADWAAVSPYSWSDMPTGPREGPSPIPRNIPTSEGMIPTGPNEYRGGENVPTYEGMMPWMRDQYYPTGSANVPTYEGMTPTGANYYAPANIPTDEGMAPTGPNVYSAGPGVNIPTDESMTPTGPNEFLPGTAGENIPTDETMTPTEAPDAYGMPELPAEPAPTYQYPAGDGTYTTLDENGQPAAPAAAAPGLSDRPGQLYPDVGPPRFGGWGQPTGYFSPGTSGPGPLSNLNPSGITYNDILASGIKPSGNWASSVPAPGGMGGTFGQGGGGYLGTFWDRLVMANYLRGGDPMMGMGAHSALNQFAAAAGKPVSVPSFASMAAYYRPNTAFVPGLPGRGLALAPPPPITAGEARGAQRGRGGPGGRSMKAV